MSNSDIAAKLWNLCNILRDDGVTYHQYLNELTYLLFLKLAPLKGIDEEIPENYRWDTLLAIKDNAALFARYRDLLANLGTTAKNDTIQQIYQNANTTLRKPVNLRTLVTSIDGLDWYDGTERDEMGDIYESLLEKNANEKKSGAGQYFTPRPLINVIIQLLAPKLGERWHDPACGTFGFMISVDAYLRDRYDYVYALGERARRFQQTEALSGVELVQDAHRLALMNAKLHGLDSQIILGDTLTDLGKTLNGYDGVLANPPFGTKRGGEKPTRDDFSIDTSNKQLNFLMHIYRSLKTGGRAAVVLPDNVLFEDGAGKEVRQDLMNKCHLHTILRLPTGIFYAAGVKTNVLFFERGKSEKNSTDGVWFYDLRTDMPNFGKRTPFTRKAFSGFTAAYVAGSGLTANSEDEGRSAAANVATLEEENLGDYDGSIDQTARETINDPRWNYLSREQIAQKNDSLDLGLMADPKLKSHAELGEPVDLAREALGEIEEIAKELKAMIKALK